METRLTAKAPNAIGAPVMALGVFGVGALQRLPGGPALTQPLAAALALAWAGIVLALVVSIRRGGIAGRTQPLLGSFAIGTWVAATAVVARLLMVAVPSLGWFARGLFFVALAIWLWFMPIAIRNLARLTNDPTANPTGAILLATVATQAIALMGLRLYPDVAAVHWSAAALIGLGLACYLAGLFLVVRRYASSREWRIADDWDNTNCILHGALSITGLAAVASGIFAAADLLVFWVGAVAAFAVVEAFEVTRLAARVKELGWRRAVWVYDISQWARNFTFGMFYAFTLAFAERVPVFAARPLLERLRDAILAYGQYVVLLLLLAEALVLLWPARPKRPDR